MNLKKFERLVAMRRKFSICQMRKGGGPKNNVVRLRKDVLEGNNFPPEGFMKVVIIELVGICDHWSDCQFRELVGIKEKDVPPNCRNVVNVELVGIVVHCDVQW